MQLKDRVREAMESKEFGPAEFARACNVSKATVTFWLSGATKELKGPSAAKIEAATGYLSQWLINGKLPKQAAKGPLLLDWVGKTQQPETDLIGAMRIISVALSDADDLAREQAMPIFRKLCESPGDVDSLSDKLIRTLEPVKQQANGTNK